MFPFESLESSISSLHLYVQLSQSTSCNKSIEFKIIINFVFNIHDLLHTESLTKVEGTKNDTTLVYKYWLLWVFTLGIVMVLTSPRAYNFNCAPNKTSGSGTTSLAWTYIKYVDTVTVFAKNWNKGHWLLDDLWPNIFWGLMCDSTQGSLCPSPMKIHQSTWIQWLFCKNLKQKSLTPRWPLTPHLLRSHVWLYPRIIVSKSHENTSKYMDTVTFFAKNLNQRSLTPRWPLTPHLLRSHVWLYPRIILSKSYENTSKYVDTVNLFAKTWTKGHWPLDDLWPHICWSHMCDCAQGSLCPSPMGIRQCMWIQLSILQKLPHTYIHILRTYYILRTESVIT